MTTGSVFMPTTYADGKATLGCSPPFQLATIQQIDTLVQPLIQDGYFTEEALLALLNKADHNGDDCLCYTVPPG